MNKNFQDSKVLAQNASNDLLCFTQFEELKDCFIKKGYQNKKCKSSQLKYEECVSNLQTNTD